MRKTALLAVVCLAGLLAGCGSSTKTVVKNNPTPTGATGSTGTSGTTGATGSTGTSGVSGPTQTSSSGGQVIGSTGTMGPPTSGQYDLTNGTVLQHLTNQLGHNLASHGYTSLQGSCRAFSHTQAQCEFTGVNPQGQHFDDIFTLTVNLSTGAFTVSNIHAGHSMVGNTGTMGPPQSGQYDLTNHTVLQHLTNQIGRNLASHGYHNLRGACKAFSHTQAACAFKGINPQGQRFADVFTLTVNLRTGAFRISNVRPFH